MRYELRDKPEDEEPVVQWWLERSIEGHIHLLAGVMQNGSLKRYSLGRLDPLLRRLYLYGWPPSVWEKLGLETSGAGDVKVISSDGKELT